MTTTQAANEYDDDNRMTQRDFGNDTYAAWTYDNEDRVATLKHHCPSCGTGSAAWYFVDLAYGRDAEGNPKYRRHNHATTTSEWYRYDPADRLTEFQRGTLNSSGSEITTSVHGQDWTLDALGNWTEFVQTGQGRSGPETEDRTHRADNALTQITIDSTTTNLSYDGPGNLKDDGTYLYDYDCENRLTRVRRKSDSATIGVYAYNALGWRVKKVVSNSGDLNGTFRLLYNSAWQLLEIRSVSGSTTTVAKQFIHGWHGASSPWDQHTPYIDDHIAMLTPDGNSWTTHYYHADAMFNTLAMTDGNAAVAELAQYEAYGKAALTDSNGNAIVTSGVGNPLMRQGITRDWDTGNDENRHRFYIPTAGRWAQRDPMPSAGYTIEVIGNGASMIDRLALDARRSRQLRTVVLFLRESDAEHRVGESHPRHLIDRLGAAIASNEEATLRIASASPYGAFMHSPLALVDPSGLAPPKWLCCERDIAMVDVFSIAHCLIPYYLCSRGHTGATIAGVVFFEQFEPWLAQIDKSLWYESGLNQLGDVLIGWACCVASM